MGTALLMVEVGSIDSRRKYAPLFLSNPAPALLSTCPRLPLAPSKLTLPVVVELKAPAAGRPAEGLTVAPRGRGRALCERGRRFAEGMADVEGLPAVLIVN